MEKEEIKKGQHVKFMEAGRLLYGTVRWPPGRKMGIYNPKRRPTHKVYFNGRVTRISLRIPGRDAIRESYSRTHANDTMKEEHSFYQGKKTLYPH